MVSILSTVSTGTLEMASAITHTPTRPATIVVLSMIQVFPRSRAAAVVLDEHSGCRAAVKVMQRPLVTVHIVTSIGKVFAASEWYASTLSCWIMLRALVRRFVARFCVAK